MNFFAHDGNGTQSKISAKIWKLLDIEEWQGNSQEILELKITMPIINKSTDKYNSTHMHLMIYCYSTARTKRKKK